MRAIRLDLTQPGLDPDELRTEGIYRIITPGEAIAAGPNATHALHPLCGGMSIEEGWRCLTLFADQVIPHLQR